MLRDYTKKRIWRIAEEIAEEGTLDARLTFKDLKGVININKYSFSNVTAIVISKEDYLVFPNAEQKDMPAADHEEWLRNCSILKTKREVKTMLEKLYVDSNIDAIGVFEEKLADLEDKTERTIRDMR